MQKYSPFTIQAEVHSSLITLPLVPRCHRKHSRVISILSEWNPLIGLMLKVL